MRRLCFPFGRAMPPHDGILPAKDDDGLESDEYVLDKMNKK
jgi:hypothetical protein